MQTQLKGSRWLLHTWIGWTFWWVVKELHDLLDLMAEKNCGVGKHCCNWYAMIFRSCRQFSYHGYYWFELNKCDWGDINYSATSPILGRKGSSQLLFLQNFSAWCIIQSTCRRNVYDWKAASRLKMWINWIWKNGKAIHAMSALLIDS